MWRERVAMAPVCLYAKVIVSAQNAKLNVNKFYDRIERGGPEERGRGIFLRSRVVSRRGGSEKM
jgi:hypothetical protein